MNTQKADEELLRELACNGDLHRIESLLTNKPDLNVNCQNAINGWTALHWAAKRNHVQVVEYLLANGADRTVQANDKSTPANVCTSQSLRDLLQTSVSSSNDNSSVEPLPIVPNYLRHPVFPYISSSSTSSPSSITVSDNQMITLLCRIADHPDETDFVEFDFSKQPVDGSYNRLSNIIAQELELDHIDKLRRLPSIRIRNDRDVQRLKDNHMIEVLMRAP